MSIRASPSPSRRGAASRIPSGRLGEATRAAGRLGAPPSVEVVLTAEIRSLESTLRATQDELQHAQDEAAYAKASARRVAAEAADNGAQADEYGASQHARAEQAAGAAEQARANVAALSARVGQLEDEADIAAGRVRAAEGALLRERDRAEGLAAELALERAQAGQSKETQRALWELRVRHSALAEGLEAANEAAVGARAEAADERQRAAQVSERMQGAIKELERMRAETAGLKRAQNAAEEESAKLRGKVGESAAIKREVEFHRRERHVAANKVGEMARRAEEAEKAHADASGAARKHRQELAKVKQELSMEVSARLQLGHTLAKSQRGLAELQARAPSPGARLAPKRQPPAQNGGGGGGGGARSARKQQSPKPQLPSPQPRSARKAAAVNEAREALARAAEAFHQAASLAAAEPEVGHWLAANAESVLAKIFASAALVGQKQLAATELLGVFQGCKLIGEHLSRREIRCLISLAQGGSGDEGQFASLPPCEGVALNRVVLAAAQLTHNNKQAASSSTAEPGSCAEELQQLIETLAASERGHTAGCIVKHPVDRHKRVVAKRAPQYRRPRSAPAPKGGGGGRREEAHATVYTSAREPPPWADSAADFTSYDETLEFDDLGISEFETIYSAFADKFDELNRSGSVMSTHSDSGSEASHYASPDED